MSVTTQLLHIFHCVRIKIVFVIEIGVIENQCFYKQMIVNAIQNCTFT